MTTCITICHCWIPLSYKFLSSGMHSGFFSLMYVEIYFLYCLTFITGITELKIVKKLIRMLWYKYTYMWLIKVRPKATREGGWWHNLCTLHLQVADALCMHQIEALVYIMHSMLVCTQHRAPKISRLRLLIIIEIFYWGFLQVYT